MNCDMCGSGSGLLRAFVEGVELNVCSKCTKFGRVVGKIALKEIQKKEKPKQKEEVLQVINPNFAKLVKQKREQLNLKQEDLAKAISERASLIHKIETNALTPNPNLAKKLEAFLRIKLIEEYREEPEKLQSSKSAELTLGDFVKVRKK